MAELFKDMGDFAMAKDYNGAEYFNDGSRPLIAETELADVIICGIPDKDAVLISVHSFDGMVSYMGEAPTKEAAQEIGEDVCKFISYHSADTSMFSNGAFNGFFGKLPVSNINITGYTADAREAPEFAGPKPPIRAYIANVDDIAAMFGDIDRLRRGEYKGAWLDFPATKEAVQAVLKEIGVDGRQPQFMPVKFDTDIPGLLNALPRGADADEINYLAHRLQYEVQPHSLPVFSAVMQSGRHCGSLRDIINVTENLDCFELQPAYSLGQYAEFLKDVGRDEHGDAIARLENTNEEGLCALPSYIDRLEKYFDAEAYARDVVAEENGVFTDSGYLTEHGEFIELYNGKYDSEIESVVPGSPPAPEERPSALGRLAAAKDAAARTGAGKPPDKKARGKSPGAEL